jgi:hypothetical protein
VLHHLPTEPLHRYPLDLTIRAGSVVCPTSCPLRLEGLYPLFLLTGKGIENESAIEKGKENVRGRENENKIVIVKGNEREKERGKENEIVNAREKEKRIEAMLEWTSTSLLESPRKEV